MPAPGEGQAVPAVQRARGPGAAPQCQALAGPAGREVAGGARRLTWGRVL